MAFFYPHHVPSYPFEKELLEPQYAQKSRKITPKEKRGPPRMTNHLGELYTPFRFRSTDPASGPPELQPQDAVDPARHVIHVQNRRLQMNHPLPILHNDLVNDDDTIEIVIEDNGAEGNVPVPGSPDDMEVDSVEEEEPEVEGEVGIEPDSETDAEGGGEVEEDEDVDDEDEGEAPAA
uniref:Uncharacterized protein n=1 Tax=Panagrellus redivivus TaxID=6233 RepID=A0A7E4VQP7_PANRE